MNSFIIYNKDCLGYENGCYHPFSEFCDCSVDVVITSPPYNNGNCSYKSVLINYAILDQYQDKDITQEFSDDYPIESYKERLTQMFRGVMRILKADGIFILDVNDEITYGSHDRVQFKLGEYVKEIGNNVGFSLFKEYTYQVAGDSCEGHTKTQFVLLFTKTDAGKCNYSYLNIDVPNDVNPFRTQYDFSRSIPREVCWPPELLFDFIEIFRLQEGKIIVDPYSGESALGLIIKTQTGISQSRYFGYEIVDKVAERAIEYSKREFGVESILFGRAFRDAFDIDSVFYKEWNLSYVGAVVLDKNVDPFIYDIHYADPNDDFRKRLTHVTAIIRDENLPYLGSILGRMDSHEAHMGCVFIYRRSRTVYVRYGSNIILTANDFKQKIRKLRIFLREAPQALARKRAYFIIHDTNAAS